MKNNSKEHRNRDIWIGCLSAIAGEMLFGFSFLFTKNAAAEASAFALLGWRFLLAWSTMTLLAAVRLVRFRLDAQLIRRLLPIAILCPCIYFIGETIGISHTTVTESGVFIACVPVVSVLFSTWILKKKPTRFQATGIVITLIGVVITVVAVGTSSSLSVIGYLFLTIAVVSYSIYSSLVEKNAEHSGIELTYVMLSAGAVVFVILALAEAAAGGSVQALLTLPFRSGDFRIAILYQGIGCSILAFFLMNLALSRIGVNRTSSFVGVSTITAIAAGTLLMKEAFTAGQFAGAVIIILGIYIANAGIKPGERRRNTADRNGSGA